MILSTLVTYTRQADRYTPGREGRPIRFVGIHSMEAPERSTMAEWCIDYFANNTEKRNASTHYAVDNNSVAAGVSEADTAWTISSFRLNCGTINIELAGYAAQSATRWNDEFSRSQMSLLAKLVADILKRRGIPNRVATDQDIRDYVANPTAFPASRGGIITHGQVTRALSINGGHTDPGPNFPMTTLISKVNLILAPPKPVSTYVSLRRGSTGSRVKALQYGLNRVFPRYSNLAVDGRYGAATEAVVKEFQRRAGLVVDGVVGPATAKKLATFGIVV